MNNATWSMLNETEKALLRDAEPAALAKLDEDQLLALHDRIRRARTKYTKLYRRRATKQVARDASRGRAEEVHERTAVKAEAFEVALARVSRALARAAKDAADELKAERLSAARRTRSASPRRKPVPTRSPRRTGGPTPKRRTPIKKKAAATSRAATRRAEAARAARRG